MLKFKFTSGKLGSDVKKLIITKVERQNNTDSDVPYNISDNNTTDELTFKFWVRDLYNIQSGSHLSSITDVVLTNNFDPTASIKTANYFQEVVVNSISKAENTLSLNVKKEIPLIVDNLYIETRYNLIKYKDHRWQKTIVDKAWLDEALPEIDGVTFKENRSFCTNDDDAYVGDDDKIYIRKNGGFNDGYDRVKFIDTNTAAYGVNDKQTYDINGNLVDDNTVYYYENNKWNNIELVGANLENCLNGENIIFKSFHEYDNKSRKAMKMDKKQIYYTRENYIILDFSNTHYFGEPNEEKAIEGGNDISFYKTTEYGREIIKDVDYAKIYLYIDKYDSSKSSIKPVRIEVNCCVESYKRLVFNYDTFQNDAKIVKWTTKWVMDNNNFPSKKITEDGDGTLTDNDAKLFETNIFPYGVVSNNHNDFPFQEGFVGRIVFNRDNFFYDSVYNAYSLMYDTTVNVVQIPLSLKFENDLHHNDMLKTNFVDKTKAEMVNPITDMEKDIYTPVIHVGDSDTQINARYNDAYKIIFNLHFREHRDVQNNNGVKEEWKCERDSYWNGTRVVEKEIDKEKKKIIDLNGRVFNYSLDSKDKTMTNKYDYFSYFGVNPDETTHYDDKSIYEADGNYVTNRYDKDKNRYSGRNDLKEYQSDLLSYLGFSNDDVKYQKSKVKKSFLRISFYDSDNVGNQNLLHTSTIFIDSGDLFAKYIKNIDTEDEYRKGTDGDIYTKFEYDRLTDKDGFTLSGEPMANIGSSLTDNESYTSYNVSGVRVNREPMRKAAINVNNGDLCDNIEEMERLRMSSQFVVTDKYSSKHSSEGFYFYTYKNGDGGVFPSEIYMRVEFNHAGYGRTIPFMMPYIRKNEEEELYLVKEDISNEMQIGDTITKSNYDRLTADEKKKCKSISNRYLGRSNKIKTFDDICYDWSEIDFDNGINKENIKSDKRIGYGTIRYMKYCHIKWKYRYDKNTQKHIYYLDPDVYGTGVTSSNGHGNNIILNLYEGKII